MMMKMKYMMILAAALFAVDLPQADAAPKMPPDTPGAGGCLVHSSAVPCVSLTRNGLPTDKPAVTEDVNIYQKYIAR